jgi:hypothetical protein
MAQANTAPTEIERLAHYRNLAAQFRGWADNEPNDAARARLVDMARQYDRLAAELAARIDAVLARRGEKDN